MISEAIIERATELCKRYKIGLIPFNLLHFGERLGVGAAGEVYKANYLGTPIAVKVCTPLNLLLLSSSFSLSSTFII